MPKSVLIVDDHSTFRRFARRVLEDAGFDVVGEATDCASALEAADRLRPAAVLLDVLLPDGSGLAVAAALARRIEAPTIVLTSGRTALDLGSALEKAPAKGFICKADFSGDAFATLVEYR